MHEVKLIVDLMYQSGLKNFKALYEKDHSCHLEEVGRNLRRMMKWVNAKEV